MADVVLTGDTVVESFCSQKRVMGSGKNDPDSVGAGSLAVPP